MNKEKHDLFKTLFKAISLADDRIINIQHTVSRIRVEVNYYT